MVFNKKAISPVVATALLLVVAVVAVVGFQTWFNTYQSDLETQVEQQSATGSAITVERLEASGIVFLKNSGVTNVSGVDVNVQGESNCALTDINLTPGVADYDLDCSDLVQGDSYDVVVVAESGVYPATQLAR